ncbi:MAG: hypothetical protein GWM92_17930, partial [Gemmatimonadetes bacterium]|nr:hypothetical protein [Gemmatimonadota bacterium]NIR80676.1 hypothetical protein [Gemmatimonadota bacterium]NIT89467.1 hypothetical protein [Gemmatimonadota bacterium]NIU33270.1 hypothetical protein [Gemmatimonadota bacterium]NIU37575.1 hypothetical protein [Gemmatimonadota bacterium]
MIHTRPRYYPIRRYGGVRVVYPTRRVVRRGPRFTFKERADAPPRRAVARPRAGGARPRGGE